MGESVLILLDTHVVIWIAMDPARISKRARTALDEARTGDSGIAISDMTLPEPARLCRTRQVHLNTSLEEFLGEVERRFVVLPMNRRMCAEAFDLPATYPKGPADRIIDATALVKGRTWLTADRAIRSSRALLTIC